MTIERLEVRAYRIPTEQPEADGTLAWDHTTAVVVQASAEGREGLGFTYGTTACGRLIQDILKDEVIGQDAMDTPGAWEAMVRSIRNVGRPGVASMAIAAVDTALWDLKARLLDLPLAKLLGMVRTSVPLYASGGFTSYSERELVEQLGGWVHEAGFPRVKMKIAKDWGTEPERDLERISMARDTVGADVELFVDANGGYTSKQAIRLSKELSDLGVTWFEEPVSSDDLKGLHDVTHATRIDVAAGEYGYDLAYFSRMCGAGAIDALQVDVSRCGGVTEWLRAAALAAAYGLEISGHTAQSLHVHPACAVPNLRHLEYFHDHARVERTLFDGVLEPDAGLLHPDLTRPGMGLELKRADAEPFRVDF